ncbi:MAG: helix-turn-helix domain-containing protein [Bifidobacteriaceae bacterium]|nr:helix-turn-helix domain-containing protein [Bifidobacteriaceae bacterium]
MCGQSLTAGELSEHWGVPLTTLAHWRSLGYGPAYLKMRGIVRYRRADVEEFEEASLNTPARNPA